MIWVYYSHWLFKLHYNWLFKCVRSACNTIHSKSVKMYWVKNNKLAISRSLQLNLKGYLYDLVEWGCNKLLVGLM